MKKIYFCEKCGVWRGSNKICPVCKTKTIEIDAPLKRGSYYYIPRIPKPLPSVTTIIGDTLAKPALVYWAAQEAAKAALENPWLSEKEATAVIYQSKDSAGIKGKDIHKIIANIAKGGKVEKNPRIKGYIEAYEKFRKDIPHKILATEKIVYSKKHGYAGTLDCIIRLKNGEEVIVDFKTGKGVYKEAGIQLAAYREALKEMYPKKKTPERTIIIHLKEDGTYSLIEESVPISVFLSLKYVWEWLNPQQNNGNNETNY